MGHSSANIANIANSSGRGFLLGCAFVGLSRNLALGAYFTRFWRCGRGTAISTRTGSTFSSQLCFECLLALLLFFPGWRVCAAVVVGTVRVAASVVGEQTELDRQLVDDSLQLCGVQVPVDVPRLVEQLHQARVREQPVLHDDVEELLLEYHIRAAAAAVLCALWRVVEVVVVRDGGSGLGSGVGSGAVAQLAGGGGRRQRSRPGR
mmetsp:Transcript_22981/g.45433  ORF Transcript_22981/g.45433 Transcript_22981/m.45433 type:complete len:206 (+) Transcript_22981:244-861(+)